MGGGGSLTAPVCPSNAGPRARSRDSQEVEAPRPQGPTQMDT